MEKATEIFEKHWFKATGKPIDETTKHHMKYAIEAINEALLLGTVIKPDCDCERSKDIYMVEVYKCGKCHLNLRY